MEDTMTITLKELRNWLAGDVVHGLPYRELPGNEERDKRKGALQREAKRKKEAEDAAAKLVVSTDRRAKYDLIKRGDGKTDCRLKFGKHKDALLSELAETPDGRSYLRWMLRQSFDEDLMAVARDWSAVGARGA
jgi:hypothetical protein